MARIKGLAPRLDRLDSRLEYLKRDHDRERNERHGWRRLYKTQRWRRLRWQVLKDAGFVCQMCERVFADRVLEADHITPHRGDESLFWDRSNLQCLCKWCHARFKQRIERAQG